MVARLPNHEALVVRHQNARLTYLELQQRVEEVAWGLTGLGLKAGDRIGVWAGGCVEWVLLFLACARTGIVQVNVNPAYRSRDLEFVLRKSKIKTLFLHDHIRFVDSFPMTVSGKVQKFKIREQEICERHLEDVARIQTA